MEMESGSRKVNELRAMFHCQIPRGKEAKRLFSVFFVVIERLELLILAFWHLLSHPFILSVLRLLFYIMMFEMAAMPCVGDRDTVEEKKKKKQRVIFRGERALKKTTTKIAWA